MAKENKSLMWRPFLSFPYFDDDFWSVDHHGHPSGLSLSEDEAHIYVEAHLPGLTEEDIEISMDQNMLSIRGEKKQEQKDEKKHYYKKASTSFSYSINLPGHVDERQEPEATYKDGVLKISFPKIAEESSAKKISIKKQ